MQQDRIASDDWRRKQDENARTLDKAIGSLERKYPRERLDATVRGVALERQEDEVSFAELWRDVKEVQELFRVTKPVAKDEGDLLWGRFNGFRDLASQAHDSFRDSLESLYHENRNKVSHALLKLEQGYRLAGLDLDAPGPRPDVTNFGGDAEEAQNLLGALRLRREDRDELRGWLNCMWAKVKAIRDRIHAERRQQDMLARMQQDIDQTKDFRQRLLDRIPKHEEFLERLSLNIARDQEFLRNLDEQLADLQSQQESAWSDTFYEKVTAWIIDKQQKIQLVHQQIKERETKMDEVRAQIIEVQEKIMEVDLHILEIIDRLARARADLEETDDSLPE